MALSKSELTGTAATLGATLGTYAGVETPTHFGDPVGEFAAITRSAGVYDLGWRGKILVSGEDRVRWLNGMLTNNIKDLPPNHGNYNFLLNAQGRIQGDMYAYNRGESVLLDTEQSQVETLLRTFEHFIIMDDVELKEVSESLASIGVQGPQAAETLKLCGIEPSCAEPLVVCDLSWHGVPISVTRMASEEFLTYELWLGREHASELWEALVSAGAKPTGTDALEKFRVMAGVPRFGIDIRERDLPQETQQKHALNFTKGCYIGQEIVERIHSRGNVHRMFTGFELESLVERGAKVVVGEKEVGELTSSATVPAIEGGHERILGLGYMRREAGGTGAEVTIGGVRARVASLPFKN